MSLCGVTQSKWHTFTDENYDAFVSRQTLWRISLMVNRTRSLYVSLRRSKLASSSHNHSKHARSGTWIPARCLWHYNGWLRLRFKSPSLQNRLLLVIRSSRLPSPVKSRALGFIEECIHLPRDKNPLFNEIEATAIFWSCHWLRFMLAEWRDWWMMK